jgi:hypothetical protein
MLTAPTDLIGCDLLECTFGKVWIRLTFSKGDVKLFLDTDNSIQCASSLSEYPQPFGTREAVPVIFDFLEGIVTTINIDPGRMTIGFAPGRYLVIARDGESIDSLLKITDAETGAWLVVD